MLELYDLGCAIVENGAATLTLIVPWYGYATMDRATKVIHALAREIAGRDFVLGSTDAGRAKWVESLSNELGVPAAFVYKRRRGPESTEVTAVSTKLSGETVVTDMIRTGGSLMNAAHAYRDSGAGKLFAIATHGEFAADVFSRIRSSGLFEAIACTDSHPRAHALRDQGLIVRPVAELFLPLLR